MVWRGGPVFNALAKDIEPQEGQFPNEGEQGKLTLKTHDIAFGRQDLLQLGREKPGVAVTGFKWPVGVLAGKELECLTQ